MGNRRKNDLWTIGSEFVGKLHEITENVKLQSLDRKHLFDRNFVNKEITDRVKRKTNLKKENRMKSENKSRRDFLKLSAGLTLGSAALACRSADKAEEVRTCLDVLHARRSVRKYTSDPVPEAHLTQILDAARMAPTSGNQQPWKFLVVRDKDTIAALKTACIQSSMQWFGVNRNPTEEQAAERRKEVTAYYGDIFSAPVFVVVLTDNQSRYAGYNHHDGPLAAGALMIAARAFGYGTVYFTDSIPETVTRQVLNIPDRYARVCITPIGIPQAWPDTPPKKALDQIVAYDSIA